MYKDYNGDSPLSEALRMDSAKILDLLIGKIAVNSEYSLSRHFYL
jgi:hypothetical protein